MMKAENVVNEKKRVTRRNIEVAVCQLVRDAESKKPFFCRSFHFVVLSQQKQFVDSWYQKPSGRTKALIVPHANRRLNT